jgi:F-type H+-transporting ATPase subunit b
MNNLMVLLQEHAAEAEPQVFALSTNVSFWTVIIFLVLLLVLTRWAFPPILGYAAAREKRIQESLDEARRTRDEAEQLLAQQRQELAAAKHEAQQVIAEGKVAAEKVRHELLERARADQEQVVARARADIEREREKAVESVRREAVDLAIAAASRLVEQKLGADEDRKLVQDYLGRVEPGGPRPGVA